MQVKVKTPQRVVLNIDEKADAKVNDQILWGVDDSTVVALQPEPDGRACKIYPIQTGKATVTVHLSAERDGKHIDFQETFEIVVAQSIGAVINVVVPNEQE